jgi:hypothetical protein
MTSWVDFEQTDPHWVEDTWVGYVLSLPCELLAAWLSILPQTIHGRLDMAS